MTRARLALLALAPLWLVTCDKSSGGSTPPEIAAADPAGDGGAAVPANDGAADGDADDAADGDTGGGDGASTPAKDPLTTDAGDPPPTTTDEPADDGDEPDTPPSKGPKSAKFELPKPVNTKIKASCGKDPGVGEKLKAFKLPSTEPGKTVSNGTYRGRVMLVNFWGTWCAPCLKELPKFAQLYRRYRKYGMTLLAIATDDDAAAVTETLDKKKIAAKVAIAGEEYAGKYGAPEFPFTFVVDHNGVIVSSYFGYEPECMGKLEADIREQLDKRAAAAK